MRIAFLALLAAVLLAPATQAAQMNTTPEDASSASAETAPAAKGFSDSERATTEGIVKDYIAKHPEEIVGALQEMQKREQVNAEEKSKQAVATAKDRLFNDPDTVVGGNPKGDVSIVEFYDYQCGYCKMSEETVEKILKEDKNVKFYYKNFPILGPMSVTAAKAAIASQRQGKDKFVKFHEALLAKKDHLTEDMIYATAKDAGLDVAKLKKDMEDPGVEKIMKADQSLGSDIGVRGTPMFIIGENVYPGALQYDQMKQAIADARGGKKN